MDKAPFDLFPLSAMCICLHDWGKHDGMLCPMTSCPCTWFEEITEEHPNKDSLTEFWKEFND